MQFFVNNKGSSIANKFCKYKKKYFYLLKIEMEKIERNEKIKNVFLLVKIVSLLKVVNFYE